MTLRALVAVLVLAASGTASARTLCEARLDRLEISWQPGEALPGVDDPVEVTGPLGGVTYVPMGRARPLVLDCSLVYSLALAGRYLIDEGLTVAVYTDSYHQRFVRGTTRWSKHSFGLALDVHYFRDEGDTRRLSVEGDYQKGLGRGRDCIGRPQSDGARSLRIVWCRLQRSELFKLVLDPDFDEDHRNHFHMQAMPWDERDDLAWR